MSLKVDKIKKRVNIICGDGSMIKGVLHINPGERIIDFLNDHKETFVAVTSVEFYNFKEIHSFRIFSEMSKKKTTVILNKAEIKTVEEL